MELFGGLFAAPKESCFLIGLRGTGKSTWLRQNYSKAIYVDLLNQEVFRTYLARPERLRDVISAGSSTTTVILDEVQKVPSLLDEVHRLIV